ncbi:unnamed protein product [Meganyctiphanes norvegica]|uniref:C-type lectin domain-containing protein n=1 Tax=Meganyctiphanes norvegica TaxID=48144 RepID=A0AAV2QB46_MEGNR
MVSDLQLVKTSVETYDDHLRELKNVNLNTAATIRQISRDTDTLDTKTLFIAQNVHVVKKSAEDINGKVSVLAQNVKDINEPLVDIHSQISLISQNLSVVKEPVMEIHNQVILLTQNMNDVQDTAMEINSKLSLQALNISEVKETAMEINSKLSLQAQNISDVKETAMEINSKLSLQAQNISDVKETAMEINSKLSLQAQNISDVKETAMEINSKLSLQAQNISDVKETAMEINSKLSLQAQSISDVKETAMEINSKLSLQAQNISDINKSGMNIHNQVSILAQSVSDVKNDTVELNVLVESINNIARLINHIYQDIENGSSTILQEVKLGVEECNSLSNAITTDGNNTIKQISNKIEQMDKRSNQADNSLVNFLSVAGKTHDGQCHPMFFSMSTKCYKLFNDRTRSWEDAKNHCKAHAMRLAEPADAETVELRKYLLNNFGNGNVWLGAKADGSKYVWQDSRMTLRNGNHLWDPDQSRGSYTSTKYCLMMFVYTGSQFYPGQPYYSSECSNSRYTLCEAK